MPDQTAPPVTHGLFGPGIFGTGIDLSALDEDTAWRLGVYMGEQLAAALLQGRRQAIADLRDTDKLAAWTDTMRQQMETERMRLSWTPLPRSFARWAADYLDAQTAEVRDVP